MSQSLSERRAQLPNVSEKRITVLDVAYIGPVIVASIQQTAEKSSIYFPDMQTIDSVHMSWTRLRKPTAVIFFIQISVFSVCFDQTSALEVTKEMIDRFDSAVHEHIEPRRGDTLRS